MPLATAVHKSNALKSNSLKARFQERGLTLTHQRQVIYDTLMGLHGHPSPEEVFARVRRKVPSISLNTVYSNLKMFVASGILREVSPHHGSLRVEVADHQHHHLVCSGCKSILDIDEDEVGPIRLKNVPKGFAVQRFAVDIIGKCAACQRAGR